MLLFTTCFSKLLSVACRIILGRNLSSEGLGMYMMVLPTLGLCITLAQMGIPGAVFKLCADPKYKSLQVLFSGLMMALFNSVMMASFLVIFSKPMATYFLKNPLLALSLQAVAFFIPMASTNNTLRSYFLGQEKLLPPAFSQIIEELVRIIFMFLCFYFFADAPLAIQVFLAFIAMVLGEIGSSLFMLCFFKIKSQPHLQSLSELKKMIIYKEILPISLPVTASQLMHSLGNFLEPLLLTSTMLKMGWTSSQINIQYGIVNGYVLSLLMIPTFITSVVYRLTLPKLTKSISQNRLMSTRKQLFISLFVCLLLGLPFSGLFYFFPEFCLTLFYKTSKGASILKYLAWPFLIYYLQTPLSACLHALSKNKLQFVICTLECLVSLWILYLSIPNFGATSVAISLLAGLICNTVLSFIAVFYYLFLQKE